MPSVFVIAYEIAWMIQLLILESVNGAVTALALVAILLAGPVGNSWEF